MERPGIAKINPGAKLPDSTINVVVRADASGTIFVFSQHLSAISKEFASQPRNQRYAGMASGHQIERE